MTDALFFLLGVLCLWKGGDTIVDGATAIARRFGISELVIGLTLVSIGTSLPELIVTIMASIQNEPDIIMGNILGSNISNTLLILGCTGMLCAIPIPDCRLRREVYYYLFTLTLLFFCMTLPEKGLLSFWHGISLIAAFLGSFLLFFMPKDEDTEDSHVESEKSLYSSLGLFTVGCILLPLGGHWLVNSAINIATVFGLSKAFVSLFAVALGTSLPELVTSVLAAKKGNAELAIGNVIGSNIFNITLILGTAALISPLQFSLRYFSDFSIMCLSIAPLLIFLKLTKRTHFSKKVASLLFIAYVVYIVGAY